MSDEAQLRLIDRAALTARVRIVLQSSTVEAHESLPTPLPGSEGNPACLWLYLLSSSSGDRGKAVTWPLTPKLAQSRVLSGGLDGMSGMP